MRNDHLASCLWAHDVWGGISRKPLEIETWVQRTTNKKWPIPSPMVTWPMTSRDPERSRSWPQYVWCLVSQKWREIATWWQYGVPIGNGPLGIEWSRDRWHHVTLKGRGHNPNMFGAHYLGNGWRQRLGDNGAHIGNGYLGIEWLRDRWRHVTLKCQSLDANDLGGQDLENGWRCRLCPKDHRYVGNGLCRVEWSRARWRHVSSLLIRNSLRISRHFHYR